MASAQKWKNKSSELDDLKKDLTEKKVEKRIEAVKKIIGNLNVGKDVSSLFFPVLKCLDSDSIELRKLVYLYIIHYSKDRPDDSIMAINQLVKVDCLSRRTPRTNPTRLSGLWPSEPWAVSESSPSAPTSKNPSTMPWEIRTRTCARTPCCAFRRCMKSSRI